MRERIEAFICSRGAEGSFEQLALELFAYQYETVTAYRRLCALRDVTPSSVDDWRQIPAAPVDLFKDELGGPGLRRHVFFSSGTTQGEERRSRHALSSLGTYRVSALTHFETMVLADRPGPMSVLVLAPSAETHPQSSLGQMFSWIAEACSDGAAYRAFDESGAVAMDRALEWLAQASARAAPVLVLAVTSAITAVLAEIRRRGRAFRLPADSRIVDTGGNKTYGRAGSHAHTYSARALTKAAWTWLHVPGYLCINEYGMTEMLSQFYDDACVSRVRGKLTPRAKVGAPWVRTSIVDPMTLAPVATGERGLLRHVDLANWETIAFLQTHDVGRSVGNGFEVLGRTAGAEPRGCSTLVREVADDDARDSDRAGSDRTDGDAQEH